jgi:tRNA threonylcarbamoyladenosine biosynthesis protein TsaE
MNTVLIEKKSFSELETELFAEKFARTLKAGCIIALHGELGAGKTVFARGFARGIGVTEQVSSPTYTIIQEYSNSAGQSFFHLDLYRIENSISALAFGVDEYLSQTDSFTILEWPERISDILPNKTIHVVISHAGEFHRQISVRSAYNNV